MTDKATPTLRQRCDTALQSLPDAPYKTMLAVLFDDMTAEVERLAAQAAPTTADRWNDAALPPEIEQRLAPWLTNGAALHPATVNLVVRFARALSKKLAAAETKYGYSDGWLSPDWMDECRAKLMEHIAKGDPRDVAAYCAFLWHHGASTVTSQPSQAPVVQATSDTARRLAAEFRGTVARKDFEAWGEEVLPLLDGMAAAPVVQAVPDSVKFICVDCTGCEKCRASSGATTQAVRMLTEDEQAAIIDMHSTGRAQGDHECAEAIQRKFCEVNKLPAPADGVIGGV